MRRWNGWGDASINYPLPKHGVQFLATRIGVSAPPNDCSFDHALAQVKPTRLPPHPHLSIDAATRLAHSFGQSLPDWLCLRFGQLPRLTDGVWIARDQHDIVTALQFARAHHARVIIYGGGTSVVGHLTPKTDHIYLTLSLARLCKLKHIKPTDQLACFEAGVTGPVLEAQLRAHGFTLGHFPQSFEFSTLGGWVATRSSGQQSHRYGRIEQLFAGGTVLTEHNELTLPPFPASAAGPDLREWVMGSEGRFGVISDAWVRVSPLPEYEQFRAVFFPNWIAARRAAQQLAQGSIPFSMLRLSNARETETMLSLAVPPSTLKWLRRYLRFRGCGEQACLMLLGLTGTKADVQQQWRASKSIIRAEQGCDIGTMIGSKWAHNRFRSVYLRNSLWDAGYAVDTVETACHWSNVDAMVHAIETAAVNALLSENENVWAYTHLSHVYSSGSSVYSTFVFRHHDDYATMQRRWTQLKTAVSNAIQQHGGTISHQHGVGHDHQPWFEREKGQTGLAWIGALQQHIDPDQRFATGNLIRDHDS